MNSFSDITVFAVALAINFFLFGALLAGGLAVVLRFTENVSPRLRYLISVAVFVMAIFIPFAATALKNSAGQKALVSFAEPELQQENKNTNSTQLNSNSIDNIAEPDLPQDSGKSTNDFINDFVLTITRSFAGKLFLSVWILGGILLFLWQTVGVWRLKQSKKFWTQATEFEKKSLRFPKNISLYFADDQTPGTVGWLRPSIVLPKEFPNEISPESKRFIVQHELAHVRWCDPFAGFLLRTVRNIFWVSPALWLIEHLIHTEREAAADRAAIDALTENRNSQATALNYAETLLSIARAFKSIEHQNRQPQFVGIGARSDLEIRIRRLLSSCRTTRRQIASAVCACVLTAVTTAVIPVASFSKITEETSSENSFFAADQKKFSVVENSDVSSFADDSIISSPVKSIEKFDGFIRSKTSLKKSANENSSSTEEIPIPDRRENRTDLSVSNSDDRDDNRMVSAKILSDEDAAEAELRENRQAAAKLNDLEPLPASSSLNGELNTLQKIRPASESTTVLPDEDELSRQKAASELDRRRTYQANYPKSPTAVPKRETYETKYVSYPARQSEQ